jgi:hypothetical protein
LESALCAAANAAAAERASSKQKNKGGVSQQCLWAIPSAAATSNPQQQGSANHPQATTAPTGQPASPARGVAGRFSSGLRARVHARRAAADWQRPGHLRPRRCRAPFPRLGVLVEVRRDGAAEAVELFVVRRRALVRLTPPQRHNRQAFTTEVRAEGSRGAG